MNVFRELEEGTSVCPPTPQKLYISDEVTAAGDAAFRKKAQQAFQNLAHKASIIMVAHNDATLRAFCESGILLKDGKATWFDKLEDALLAYKESY